MSLCLFSFWFLEFLRCCGLSNCLTEVIFNFSNGLSYFLPTLFPKDNIRVALVIGKFTILSRDLRTARQGQVKNKGGEHITWETQ